MTVSIKFKIVNKTPTDEGTAVTWVVGFSDGKNTSTGTGAALITQSIRGLAEDEILQLALNSQGGLDLVDELYEYHSVNLKPCYELEFFDDWYAAYVFACNQLGTPIDSKEVAYENVSLGFGTYHTRYNHSIFNITEQCHWSHTFIYEIDGGVHEVKEDDSIGRTFHVKIRNSVVAEWYERIKDGTKEWVALDLTTAQPLEYYLVDLGSEEGTTIMQKFTSGTDELATVTTHGQPGKLNLPQDFIQGLAQANFEHSSCIFGYGTKSYGKIVEYTLLSYR